MIAQPVRDDRSGPSALSLLRELPSVDRLLAQPQVVALAQTYGRELTTQAVRATIEQARADIRSGDATTVDGPEALASAAARWLDEILAPTLRPVINATGVIIHTNLGRAPLSREALAAISSVAAGYSTLEYDVEAGQRGSRTVHAEQLLTRLTGAEAGLVVNNNAAAIMLMLSGLCRGREVIISRGQLVEIGGGFRIPDVLAQSGATLVEVGTTNRTHLRDYAEAINDNTAAILVAHYSNYRIIGFTSQPELAELAALAHERNILMLYDQGSGAMVDVRPYGLEPEPTVPDGLRAGCDIVAFSGDKMLGGPQAGILLGRAEPIAALKRHPLARAVRADKLCLAGLAATLRHYLVGDAMREIPVLWMIARPAAELAAAATSWATTLAEGGLHTSVIDGESRVGGGSLPGTSLPTHLLAIEPVGRGAERTAAALRRAEMPVIVRVQDDRLLVDPRTVLPDQVDALLNTLTTQCAQGASIEE